MKIPITQQTFQHCFNVVVKLIWLRDVGRRQTNVETMLCMSTLKFTTLNKVESTFSISTLILTTLESVEATLWIWPFSKKYSVKKSKKNLSFKKNEKKKENWNWIWGTPSLDYYFKILLTLFPILRETWRRIFAKPQKFLWYSKNAASQELYLNRRTW